MNKDWYWLIDDKTGRVVCSDNNRRTVENQQRMLSAFGTKTTLHESHAK